MLCSVENVTQWLDFKRSLNKGQGHLIWYLIGWIGLCSVLRPRQHSIGYMGDGFYRSKDPTNSIKVLKEDTKDKANNENN